VVPCQNANSPSRLWKKRGASLPPCFGRCGSATQAEIDRIVQESLLEILDSGYIFFFRAKGFDDEFAPRTEANAFDKTNVLATFEQGDLQPPDFIGLSCCATDAGRRYFATLPDEASRLFPARDPEPTDPPRRPSRAARLTD
jgi:hypothetical protein